MHFSRIADGLIRQEPPRGRSVRVPVSLVGHIVAAGWLVSESFDS